MNTLFLLLAAVLGGDTQGSGEDSLAITVAGAGTPVVFLPGLIGSAYSFRNVIPLLDPTRFQTIVIEPLGFGASARPPEADYSLGTQADRIVAALDTLVAGPVWLVAHSVGASIAYRAAYRHPDRVAGVISLEGGPTETLMTPGVRTALRFSRVIRTLGSRAIVELIRQQMKGASADDGWLTDEVIVEYTRPYQNNLGTTLEGLRAMSRAVEPELLSDHLNEILCPVMLLLGDVDHGARPDEDAVALLLDRVPDIRIDSVADAGHFLHEENPAAVARVIRRAVEGTLAGGR